jgi:hypothetical protein
MRLTSPDYNTRLFGGNPLRHWFHTRRFEWLATEMARLGLRRANVLELGCNDAHLVERLRNSITLDSYVGLDADKEGGVAQAQRAFESDRDVTVLLCSAAREIPDSAIQGSNVAICLEVFEHMSQEAMESYLDRIACEIDGYLFVTIPVQRGPVFVLKQLASFLLRIPQAPYTFGEFLRCSVSHLRAVKHDGHKGFDDRTVVQAIRRRFDVISVAGVWPGIPPAHWNTQVGIVAATRRGSRLCHGELSTASGTECRR